MIKASNVQNNLRDKLILVHCDWSTAAPASLLNIFFDEHYDWEVIEAYIFTSTAYTINQAVTALILGYTGATNYFVTSTSLGTSAITAGTATALTLVTAQRVLPHGYALCFSYTYNGSNLGEGELIVRLRAKDLIHVGSKRPQAAQTPA